MSKLQELISRLCPDGVPFMTLGELGKFFGGLTGKSKDDFKDGNAKYITYMNIHSNLALNIDVRDFVKVAENEKQNRIIKGDILFTGSSETPNECGFTSVVTTDVSEPIYLNSFCFGLRLNNPDLFNLDFLKHLLRSAELRNQISKTASGVTRFNVSKARLSKVTLPVPPIEVQTEIAEILDRFADYAATLQARKEQYEYYRNLLLTFNPSAYGCGTDGEQEIKVTTWGGHSYVIDWKPMEEVCDFFNGFAFKSNLFKTEGDRIIRITNISESNIDLNDSKYFDKSDYSSDLSKYRVQKGNILIAMSGATTGKIGCYNNDESSYINQRVGMFKPHKKLSERFLFHILSTKTKQFYVMAGGGAQPNLSSNQLMSEVIIPIPPLELQDKIVAILDRFETLVNDLTQGLPAEIAAVKEQYEYYRNKLLTFKQKTA